MLPQLGFFGSIAFSSIAWGVLASRYVWPQLRRGQGAETYRPLLTIHAFRFIGLAFLVRDVVSPDLPHAFATSAAIGDSVAAALALLALLSLRNAGGVFVVWLFNVWGSIDLVNAFYEAHATGLSPGQLGAAYFIPTLFVPLLLITHGLMFRLLVRRQEGPAGDLSPCTSTRDALHSCRSGR